VHASKRRQESSARFDKPSTDPTTGAVQKDKDGQSLRFIPSSLRFKCPIKASTTTNNDNKMVELLEEAAKTHSDYQKAMTEHAKKVAGLEITIRQKKLRTLVWNLLDKMALAKCIIAEHESGFPDGMQLERNDLVKIISFGVLKDASVSLAAELGCADGAGLAVEYERIRGFHYYTLELLATNDGDIAFTTPIITRMNTELPILTINLWTQDDQKDKQRQINAALQKELQSQAMLAANEAVEAAMDQDDADEPTEAILDVIRKESKKTFEKGMVQLKKQLRKNSSGEGEKNQSSRPTKSGRESKNKSNTSSSKKSGNKTKENPNKDKTDKSSKKKKSEDKSDAPPKKAGKSSRPQGKSNQGSAGGCKGGGKQKGAGRR
jgi:hypothetical protein